MHILITGAAGSGTSTLAQAVALCNPARVLESDDFFWRPTNSPYQEKFGAEERAAALLTAVRASGETVVAGAVIGWGHELEHAFDLVVFLYLPTDIRVARLRRREELRFGKADPEFLDWAAQYDAGTAEGRTLARHREWLRHVTCSVLCLERDESVDERLKQVLLARDAIIRAKHS
ncbi:hypothetical protein [Cupriavidus oxalaticus]|uniref:Adenylate kinase n=1 Tax=Cupriavidus oxalaticus TaxID=96344 RepID=A0A4P7LH04_9BURK|nr:hypothetical protein [Cupriavidus oxalaticus]QBY55045.1 hypothetical protein E0W60_28185 [Cupriavidus oxalaticus]